MIIYIHDTKTVGDLQDKFNEFFPFLKIEFYEHQHHWYEHAQSKKAHPSITKLEDIRKNHLNGNLVLDSLNQTGQFEQAFRKQFNLNVQVFRQEGSKWIETTESNYLSLHEQNEIGRKISTGNKESLTNNLK